MEGRGGIWLRTLLVVLIWTAAIYELDQRFFVGLERPLALALSFALVQAAAIFVMLAVLLTRRGMSARRARRSLRVAHAAANAIAEHAAGSDRLRVLRELRNQSARDVDRALASFVSGTRGSMQERVSVLARELGAAQTQLLHAEETRTLFDRILLADETRSRAAELAKDEIPRALASGDEQDMIAALDLLRGWRFVLPVANFDFALVHPSEEVRVRANLALPYTNGGILTLADSSPRVRAAAAQAAGRLRLIDAVPSLDSLLDDQNHDVKVAAAFALAMTAQGLEVLQRRVSEGNRVAFEALEKATMGRLELA